MNLRVYPIDLSSNMLFDWRDMEYDDLCNKHGLKQKSYEGAFTQNTIVNYLIFKYVEWKY